MIPDLSLLLPMLAALLVIGAFAGVIGGLLGVGGGIVLVPAFFYAFGHLGYGGDQLMQVCVATSMATIVITSIRSVAGHNRKGAVDWQVLRSWAPALVLSAAIGTLVASHVSSMTLQLVFGALAGLAGLWMAFGRDHWRLGEAMPENPVRSAEAATIGFFSPSPPLRASASSSPCLRFSAFSSSPSPRPRPGPSVPSTFPPSSSSSAPRF
jgi:uncharacterized protein